MTLKIMQKQDSSKKSYWLIDFFSVSLSSFIRLCRLIPKQYSGKLTTDSRNKMKTKDIHQEVHFNATPKKVYDALMDSKKHAEFTGADAEIVAKVGGKFTVHGGYITGENLELQPGKRIVQSWHAEEEYWPADHFSKVIFDLKADKGGTKLNFTQEGVPVEHVEEIAEGWETYYWEPMKEMLEDEED
jgi:activator of HSP90 ATPase